MTDERRPPAASAPPRTEAPDFTDCACDGVGMCSDHIADMLNSSPSADTGGAAETRRPSDAGKAVLVYIAEVARLRARLAESEQTAESDRAFLEREREGRSFWMALALQFGRYLNAEQVADARKAVRESRAALTREPTP